MGSDQTGSSFLHDRPAHEDVRHRLHAYAFATVIGESPEVRYPDVAAHLAECATCRNDLNELIAITHAGALELDAPIGDYPLPDMSRLTRPWLKAMNQGRPWFIDRLGRLWLEFSEALLRSWEPSPMLGPARGALLYEYRHEAQADDPSLSVEIFAEEHAETTLVCVMVDVPTQAALDQAGTLIVLHGAGAPQPVETDRSGTARFAHVPRSLLADLRLEIMVDRSA
jgi:anti-sigma factor RsiW